ncbi:MAG TPA: hypothetical protein VN030_08435 [Cellvibrio sp.]|nr:hypothetical protein [Cellvibrio sp.]
MKYLCSLLLLFTHCCLAQQTPLLAWSSLADSEWSEIRSAVEQSKWVEHSEFTEILASVNIAISKKQVSEKITKVFYFPDSESIKNNGFGSLLLSSGLDTVKIFAIASIGKDGRERYLARDKILVNSPNSADSLALSTLLFTYPELEAGSFAVISYLITRNIEHREADWSKELYAQTDYPRENFSLRIQWQANINIQWRNPSRYVECQESSHTIACVGKNIPKAVSEDIYYSPEQMGAIQRPAAEPSEHARPSSTDMAYN